MNSVDAYLESLPVDRRAEIAAVRDVVNANLPPGYVEAIDYGMLSWVIPLSRYPHTYNGHPLPIASLAAQKSHCALYLMGVYGIDDGALRTWFQSAWQRSGKKLDMGKSCVRFHKAADLALDVIAQTIAKVSVEDYLAHYEKSRGAKLAHDKKKKRATKA
jgi:hypothetical protein